MNNENATEVRCSEQSKGGLKYELVLSEPTLQESPKILPSSPRSILSVEEIENKLRAATERRQSLEIQKLNFVTEKLSHVSEVKGKREEFNNNFIESSRQRVEHKMEAMKENRENQIKTKQDKAREIVMKVDEKRHSGATSELERQEKLEAILKKQESARQLREKHLNELQESLKEHDKHIVEVRRQMGAQTEHLLEKSQRKLEMAEEKRNAMLREIQEKRKEHERHVEEVRLKAMSLSEVNAEHLSG